MISPMSKIQITEQYDQMMLIFMQEHKCVLDSCRVMEAEGFKVTYLPVQSNGIIRMEVNNDSQKVIYNPN